MKKFAIVIILVILVISIVSFWKKSPKVRKLSIVFTGVLHGSLLPKISKSGDNKGKFLGGLAYLSGLLKDLRKTSEGNLIVLDCGDNSSGTPEAYYTQGEAIIRCMNHLGIDAMMIGNREFDFGAMNFENNLKISNFTYLGTNMIEKSKKGSKFEFIKIIIKNGIKVGILALVPPETASLTEKENTKGFEFLSIKDSFPKFIQILKKKNVDLIIALTQLDATVNLKELKKLSNMGIDIIQVLEYGTSMRFTKIGNSYIVAHDGNAKGTNIQMLDLELSDANWKIDESKRIFIRKDKVSPDLKLSEKINEYVRKIDGIMNQVFAQIDGDYTNEYYAESVIGNVITDIMKNVCKSDLAFQNSAGIRSNLKKGNFTIRMLHDLLPFDNDVILMVMKGEDIRALLESLCTPERGVLQTSGVKYEFNPDEPEGERLASIMVNGEPLNDETYYNVATNSYLASGGKRYSAFSKAKKVKSFGSLRGVVKNAITKQGIFKGQIEERITMVK